LRTRLAVIAAALLLAAPACARDSLGVYSGWGAFRDPGADPRCYALAKAERSRQQREFQPYADVAIWPRRGVRGQVHFRLSRRLAPNAKIFLDLGDQRLELTGGGNDAWAQDRRMDAAVVAAMRSAQYMTVNSKSAEGRGFSDSYRLAGAATAMDAAAIGCAGIR
jgi:hypothetical protein